MKKVENSLLDETLKKWSADIFKMVTDNREIVEDLLEIAQDEIFGSIAIKTQATTAITNKESVVEAEQKVAYWDKENTLYNLTIWLTVRHDGLLSYRTQYKGASNHYYIKPKGSLRMFLYLSEIRNS